MKPSGKMCAAARSDGTNMCKGCVRNVCTQQNRVRDLDDVIQIKRAGRRLKNEPSTQRFL
jgi:hypothetical protein